LPAFMLPFINSSNTGVWCPNLQKRDR